MKQEPIWVLPATVKNIHLNQLSLFGGRSGIRDEGLLDSALQRPVFLWHYESPSLFDMATAYAFGIAKNHPFVDGNKRTAFVVSVLFLDLNGLTCNAGEVDATETFLALAAGELSEGGLATWFAENSSPATE